MSKYILILSLFLLPIPIISAPFTTASLPNYALETSPSYAKWGRIAMKETIEKYPDASIVDYLYVGKTESNSTTTEKFKLWLHQADKEFGVFIDIHFHTETEEIIDIHFEETDR